MTTNSNDLYDILGVTSDASGTDIRKAYDKMALKYHPDKNKDCSSREKFIKIKNAHDILIDPITRRNYDSNKHRNNRNSHSTTDKPNTDKPNTDKPNTDKPNTDKPNTDKPNYYSAYSNSNQNDKSNHATKDTK